MTDGIIPRATPHLHTYKLVGAWLTWAIVLAILLWAANKSIAMQDEGSLLLGYRFPSETINSPRHFSLLIAHLVGWAHLGVIGYRILKIVLDGVAAAIFALGLARALYSLRSATSATSRGFGIARDAGWPRYWLVLLPYVEMANAFGYGTFGQTVSYNSLNPDALMLSTGLLLSALGTCRLSVAQALLYLGAGLALGVDLFIKFSSSIAFLGAAGVLACLAARSSPRDAVMRAGLVAVGYIAGICLFFLFILDPHTWLVSFRSNLAAQATSSHDPGQLFSSLGLCAAILLVTLCLQVVLTGTIFAFVRQVIKSEAAGRRLLADAARGATLVAVGAVSLQETLQSSAGGWGTVVGVASLIGTAAGVLLASRWPKGPGWRMFVQRGARSIALYAVLLLAPLIGVLGSNVNPLTAAAPYMPFWLAIIATLLIQLPDTRETRLAEPILWLAPQVLCVAVLVQGLVLHPYGNPKSLLAQTEALARGGDLAGLQVDPASARFFAAARRIITKADPSFHPGTPIISAYNLPGLVYVLGGVEPGAPWFFPDVPQQRLNCVELHATHLHGLDKTIIIALPAVRPSFARCLRSMGILYPARYRLAGSVYDPYDYQTARIYAPRP